MRHTDGTIPLVLLKHNDCYSPIKLDKGKLRKDGNNLLYKLLYVVNSHYRNLYA